MPDHLIKPARWPDDEAVIRAVREAVFVNEQGVPAELEWDGLDPQCTHVLAFDPEGNPIGTARLKPDGYIGRMAVLPTWRNRGVGSALLAELIGIATDRGLTCVRLNAQSHAANFYAGRGFQVFGAPFEEAGIPHVAMILHIEP